MLTSLKEIKKKIQRKTATEFLKIIVQRLFPLILYKRYYLYKDENLINYHLKPKLEQTQFIHFTKYSKFKYYQKENNLIVSDFDLDLIRKMFGVNALAFCAIIDSHLAHLTWVALNDEAKKIVEPWPMTIDWNIEACWGLAQTSTAYKRMGLYSCVHAQIGMYLKKKGIQNNKFTVKKSNLPSNEAMSYFKPTIFADGYFFKIIFWNFRLTNIRTSGIKL
jgi:hypothetical protein